ncbi:MAG: AAA family ATPase, partial [Bacteroidota bacterium]
IEVDDQGKPLPQEQSLNRKLFVGGEIELEEGETKLLKPLKIINYPKLMKRQGKSPVISIGFKDVKGSSYQDIETKVKRQVRNLYRNHRYLKKYIQAEETLLDDVQKQQLNRYFTYDLSKDDLENSLLFLSELLYAHFGKPVYILIDEYDTPINNAFLKCANTPDQFGKVLELFGGLLGAALKSNTNLKKGLITGIFRLAKANILSGLNNLGEYTLLDRRFASSYGFTQQEVDELLGKFPTSPPRSEIQRWYNGYKFGGQVFYNPWSIMRCLELGGILDHYWIDSGGTKLIDSVLLSDEVQHKLQALISGQSITSTIEKHISFDALKEPDTEPLYSLLLFGGYLNPDIALPGLDSDTYQLSIPNHEVRYIHKRRLLEWVRKK